MARTPSVKLGGVTLGGAADYGWTLSFGTQPAEQSYLLTKWRAQALPRGKPLTLTVTDIRRPLTIEHVYVLDVGAAMNPQQRVVRISDRRWLWPRRWVSAGFNVRRASAEKTLTQAAGQPVELTQYDDVIRFAKWSLYPPADGRQRWTARQVLQYVFDAIDQPVRIEPDLPELPIVDLFIEDNGAAAIDRVLAYLPGADVYLDLDGVAVVVNTQKAFRGGTTADRVAGPPLLPQLARKHVGGGDGVITDRKALRPSKVIVYFTPEVEVRFDSYPSGATRTRDAPTLINVAPSPDLSQAIAGFSSPVARGTYVDIDKLMAAWGAFGFFQKPLTNAFIAERGTGASALEHMYASGSGDAGAPYDPIAAARIRAVINHWRRTWQIDPIYVQRLSSIKANRVAILNTTTGTRARAEAYCDFIRRPSARNPWLRGRMDHRYGWFQRGWAEDITNAKPAPVIVSVLSESAGIIRTEPELDPWGLAEAITLGYPLNDMMPRIGGDAEANRTGAAALAHWDAMRLDPSFRMAVILTVIPASPNNLDRFHKIEVPASQVGYDGDGPPVHIHVQPHIMTARFAWADGAIGEQIKASILNGGPRPEQQLLNARDVQNVAEAEARAVYANLADIPDTRSGPLRVDLNPNVKPQGAIGSVHHSLTGGRTTTQVMATGYRRPVDLWKFLDAGTRQVIMRDGVKGEE